MKKFILIVLIIIICTFSGCLLLDSYPEANRYKSIIGTNLPKDSVVLESKDTHSGFMGDGILCEKIQLTEEGTESLAKVLKETGLWSEFPLSEEVRYILYEEKSNNIKELLYEKYINSFKDVIAKDELETKEEYISKMDYYDSIDKKNIDIIPNNINNGIYLFNDRQLKNYPEMKDVHFLLRASFNYTISILDFDTNILYIYELDT